MEFDSLPKDVKESIYSYLDNKEYFTAREVSKKWKTEIENPKSNLLKENLENSKIISVNPFFPT